MAQQYHLYVPTKVVLGGLVVSVP